MKHEDRGMVKYAPYQSLVEQASSLARMRSARTRVERKVLSDDEQERINEILSNYEGEELILSYWANGRVYQEEGILLGIDVYRRTLHINEVRVPLDDIQSLERK